MSHLVNVGGFFEMALNMGHSGEKNYANKDDKSSLSLLHLDMFYLLSNAALR